MQVQCERLGLPRADAAPLVQSMDVLLAQNRSGANASDGGASAEDVPDWATFLSQLREAIKTVLCCDGTNNVIVTQINDMMNAFVRC